MQSQDVYDPDTGEIFDGDDRSKYPVTDLRRHLVGFYSPERLRVTVNCGEEFGPGAMQNFKDECDINTILTGYHRTGQIEHLNTQQPTFADLPDQMDFQQALDLVEQSELAFSALPSQLRDYYQNDPGQFLAGLTNPADKDRLTEWGVFKPAIGSARTDSVPPSFTPPPAGASSPSPAGDNPPKPT